MLSEQRMTRETRNWKWPNKWRHYYLRTCALRQGHTERYNDFFDLTLLHLLSDMIFHGPLARCVKLPVVHAPGMADTFSPPLWVSDPDMRHGTCVAHVPPYMPGSLPSGFLWSPWWGNIPGIPDACATRNFPYLVWGPWKCYIMSFLDLTPS